MVDAGIFSDPGFDRLVSVTREDFTATIDWGEGTIEPLVVIEVPGSEGVLTTGSLTAGTHIYRLPGEYTATITVIDDDGGLTSDTLKIVILGARNLKGGSLKILESFESDSIHIRNAIRDINESLDRQYWLDAVLLTSEKGHRVFSEEKQAVSHLLTLLETDGGNGRGGGRAPELSPEERDAVTKAISLLLNADRVLAMSQLVIAEGSEASRPRDQAAIDREFSRAQEDLAAGDLQRDTGREAQAIDRYRSAWEHALKATEIALG